MINIMFKKILLFPLFLFIIVVSLTFAPVVLAAETAPAGITPSSHLYFLDTLAEKISLFFTFNTVAKVNRARGYAAEKSAELAVMMQKNNERGQKKAAWRYQEMIKIVIKKIDEAAAKNPEFKNAFIPKMMAVINGYNDVLRAQDHEKIKELDKIAKEENDLFIKTYEAPQKTFLSLNLLPKAMKEKLCEAAAARPVKDEMTKIFEALCSPEFSGITDDDKEKQEAIYKIIFDAAARNDISNATKGMVQQIALSDLPVSPAAPLETPAVKATPGEFKNTKSREIACYFSCGSYHCPPGQKAKEKFEHKTRRIFDPWDWGGASLIDLLLLSVKVAETPAPALSFAVAEGSCVDSGKVSWQGSGIIDTAKLASESAFNEDAFLNNFQAAFEEARRNCPARGDDSYTFTLMCSVRDFIEGKRYSEQYGAISEKCSASEAEAAQIEKTHVHNETWTYMASQHKTENAEDIDKVEMMITPGEISQAVEFDAATKELKTSGALPAGDYAYEIKFILKGGQTVSPQGSGGHFTIRPCSPAGALDCSKLSAKITFDPELSDDSSCGNGLYYEEFVDSGIYISVFVIRPSSPQEARQIFDQDVKNQHPGEISVWTDILPTAEKMKIGNESFIFTASDNPIFHRGFIEVKTGQCIIGLYGSASPSNMKNNAPWWKYHLPTIQESDAGTTEINRHPDFDHGKERLKNVLIEIAQEIVNNVKGQCGD